MGSGSIDPMVSRLIFRPLRLFIQSHILFHQDRQNVIYSLKLLSECRDPVLLAGLS